MFEILQPGRVFYGWWMVLACLIVAVVSWSLGTFGMSVYIHVLSGQRGFSIGLISTAVTISYLVTAACLMSLGSATAQLGPKPVIAAGAVIMAVTVAALGFCREIWQIFLVFAGMGVGRACLSSTTISTTLAPWFERHQGRAVSIALLGASIGGMIGTPLLLGGIALLDVEMAFAIAGLSAIVILAPIVVFVLKRRPADLGLFPDGETPSAAAAARTEAHWSRKGAMATRQFYSQFVAFALAMMVQVGFLSHHVPMVAPTLGDTGASIAVSSAAVSAFVGRVALARFADRIDLRVTTGGVLLLAAVSLAYMSLTSTGFGLLTASVLYGLTIGNLTTLSPLIARREFGAVSFGAVFGVIASAVAFATAFGPGLYGILRDMSGSYHAPLMIAAFVNLLAAGVIVWGGRKPMPSPH
ncbi:MAG: MFS transporter [Afipia sp.]|nr:MFS transporter [Afipia sp.]